MNKVSEAAEAILESEENENEPVTNSQSWRGKSDAIGSAVRMIVSPWYLDEFGNSTRTVRGT